jgi:hypothetical protein
LRLMKPPMLRLPVKPLPHLPLGQYPPMATTVQP